MSGGDEVLGYTPECSALQVSTDASPAAATAFTPTEIDYYTDLITGSMIPGFVLGGLALLGAVVFLIWMCVQCACLRRAKAKEEKLLEPEERGDGEQFIAAVHHSSSGAEGAPRVAYAPPRRRGDCTASRPYLAITTLFALAVVGISVWGLVASILETNDTISGFWDVVDGVNAKATAAHVSVGKLSAEAEEAIPAIRVLVYAANSSDLVREVVAQLFSGNLDQALRDLDSTLASIQSGVQQSEAVFDSTVLKAIDDLNRDVKPPTMSIEDTWRFVVIAVMFGLTILISALVGIAAWRMRFPKTTSFLVMLLWLDVALLMLLGAALLSGAKTMSSDACLYAETFIVAEAESSISDPVSRDQVLNGLNYYLGVFDLPDDEVAHNLTGLDTRLYHQVLQTVSATLPAVYGGLEAVSNVTDVPKDITGAVATLSRVVPEIDSSVYDLEAQIRRSNIDPIYHAAKEYLCCSVQDTAHDLFVAWTVAGCLGFVLCILCSIRVTRHTLVNRRRR